MITFVLRIYICLPVDPVFAVSIIAFLISCIVIFPNNILSDWIEKFGIYSSDIYMFHLSLLILINFIPIINIKVKLFAFILLCYCIGAGINGLKKMYKLPQIGNAYYMEITDSLRIFNVFLIPPQKSDIIL